LPVAEIDLLSPLGKRVARAGAFFSRRGTGEGVDASMIALSPSRLWWKSRIIPGEIRLAKEGKTIKHEE
jgi:hypothetical protein